MTPGGAASNAAPTLALDIGASKVEVGLVSTDGIVLASERRALSDGGDELFELVAAMVKRIREGSASTLLGVACAGPMTNDGEEVSPLNIAQWRSFPLRAELSRRLGIDVFVDGDARALALAEGQYGAARDDGSYLSMVVSTGVGGGFVMNGRLVDGATGNAGHVGHLNVVPDGRPCACGSRGCLEAEASGLAIEAITGRPPSDADAGSRHRTARLVGRAVGTLSAVLDFTRCYVAGSVALGYGDQFFRGANEGAREVATMAYCSGLTIAPSALGRTGPLLGAALVGRRGAT